MSVLEELILRLTMMAGSEPEDTPEVTRLRACVEEFLGVLLGLSPELRVELEQGMEEALTEDDD